jgi:hypothetical protein
MGLSSGRVAWKLAGGPNHRSVQRQNHPAQRARWIKRNLRQIARRAGVTTPDILRESCTRDGAPPVPRCTDELHKPVVCTTG